MHERRFVLDPLGEIAESIVLSPFDGLLKKWVEEHREKCENQTVERCSWLALAVDPGWQPA
jgi:7,8-dihydro-6-hydroxymethylpterin-pyrophosphokinase